MAPVLLSFEKYSKVNKENECVAMNKMVNMNLKKLNKNILFWTLSILLCTTTATTIKTEFIVSDCDDEFDLLLNDISPADLEKLRSCEPGEAAAWNFLLTQAGIPELLDIPFYKETSEPRTRNLIDFPEFQLCSYQDMDSIHQFTWHMFYNQTSKKNYTKSTTKVVGTRMGSYINIECKTFLSLLEEATRSPLLPPELAPLKNLNFPLIFYNLANARLEERRFGTLGHYYQKINSKTYFEAKLPIIWMIRNLNLTDKEKETLTQQFSSFFGTNFSDFDEKSFAKKHIIFDALGTGTMELSLSTKFYQKGDRHLDGGVFLFLPTDFVFARGLYGTYIEPHDQQPILNLCDLVNNIATNPQKSPQANAILYNYFIAALNQLSSALLQCPLGYNKHFCVGLKLSPYWKVREDLEFNGLYTVEFLLPQEEKRFFVPKDFGLFSEIYKAMPATTNEENNAKLLFLEERLTTTLFPRVFTTKVFPGFIFTSASNLQKSYKSWNFTGGYSGWFQTAEKFLKVSTSTPHDVATLYDISKSELSDAYMIKLFGKAHHLIHTKHHEISLTLWADASIFSNAVGNDFSLGISFDTKF